MKKRIIAIVVTICIIVTAVATGIVIYDNNNSDSSSSNNKFSENLSNWVNIPDSSQAEDVTDVENIGGAKNSANVTMELGQIANQDRYIYFLKGGKVIEYDIDTDVAIELNSSSAVMFSMAASNDYIYFTPSRGGNIQRIAKDDGRVETVFTSNGLGNIYIDGNNAFYGTYDNGLQRVGLYHRDIISDTETLLVEGSVKTFFIDDVNIYVILENSEEDGGFTLLKSPRDNIEFTKVPLSFSPIAVFAHGDDLYLSKMGHWEIVKVSDGVETELPIKSLSYRVVGNKLIYSDNFGKLKIYDLTTAETTAIYEGKSTGLYVLDGRYVCYTAFGVDWYKLYDLQTKETKLIYGEE